LARIGEGWWPRLADLYDPRFGLVAPLVFDVLVLGDGFHDKNDETS
jgi:hypothetical protein